MVNEYLEPQMHNGHLLSPSETLREQRGKPVCSAGFTATQCPPD